MLNKKKITLLSTTVVLLRRNFKSLVSKYISPQRFNLDIKYPQFPEKFKGTIVERWADYWKNLLHDYAEVIKDTAISAKQQPLKSGALLTVLGIGTYCVKNNPDEISYRDAVISYSEDMMFVGPLVRNPKTVKYLKDLEKSYNEGTIRRLSFGLFSLIWKDDYNDCLGIYKSQCKYLGVPVYRFHERIVDFGFLNKWFYLDKYMEDFDVNPEEWGDTD
ncbi:mitochondrial import inner membrane translocase subunit Tim29 [Halyomorpha halys]|uniref:mitochondrial import inner membrane translocase subunit Tim29 n=1 Tax=Halyomorpha halys TaxID=286706 RepID=UPI0006D4FEDD|nr:mitochondrial import inner membrane translocase subunit Tim29 [Halyomorpha halys]